MSLLSVMERSLSISVELCLTVLFLLFFHTVASTSSLSVFIVPLLALLVLLSLLASRPLPSPSPALLALAYVLTPVLASLARSVARDTLASTVRLLLVARLAFRDFTATDPRPLVAANAGLLSAILLCSRLDAYLQVRQKKKKERKSLVLFLQTCLCFRFFLLFFSAFFFLHFGQCCSFVPLNFGHDFLACSQLFWRLSRSLFCSQQISHPF